MNNCYFLLEKSKFTYKLNRNLLTSLKHVNSVLFSDRNKISLSKKLLLNIPKNSAIIFREYDLQNKEREEIVKNLIHENNKLAFKKKLILVGKDFKIAKKTKADGIHFSDFSKNILPFLLLRKKMAKNFIFSFSIHHERSWHLVKKFKPDLVFFSPIFSSSSHIDKKPIGLIRFSKFLINNKYYSCKNKNFMPKIYGLGGINLDNLKKLRKIGVAGFGAIDLFKNFL